MKRDAAIHLEDILDSVDKIESYLDYGEVSENGFYENPQLQDSVVRRLEVIGEAAKRVPDDFRKLHPSIPWKKMAGLRDILIHEYDEVDFEQLWLVVTKDLPELRAEIQKLV